MSGGNWGASRVWIHAVVLTKVAPIPQAQLDSHVGLPCEEWGTTFMPENLSGQVGGTTSDYNSDLEDPSTTQRLCQRLLLNFYSCIAVCM